MNSSSSKYMGHVLLFFQIICSFLSGEESASKGIHNEVSEY